MSTPNYEVEVIYCEPGTTIIFGERQIDPRFMQFYYATIYNIHAVGAYSGADNTRGMFYQCGRLVNCSATYTTWTSSHCPFVGCSCLNCSAYLTNSLTTYGFYECWNVSSCFVYNLSNAFREGITNFSNCSSVLSCGPGNYEYCYGVSSCGEDNYRWEWYFHNCVHLTSCNGRYYGSNFINGCSGSFTQCKFLGACSGGFENCTGVNGCYGRFTNSYHSNDTNSTYACANTLNGGFNQIT